MSEIDDRNWLIKAIDLSRQCPPSQKAFCVGAIILGTDGALISTGYSRERNPREHAKETAINKAIEQGKNLAGSTIYSSLEPCSPRLSGAKSCTDLIIDSGIKKVIFALFEPPVFVVSNGTSRLHEHGIEVIVLEEFAPLVKKINKDTLVS